MTYHVGLITGTGNTKCWANGHRKTTVIVQARRNLDLLSPDLWKYLGERETTKARLVSIKSQLLDHINTTYHTSFTSIIID